MRWSFASYFCCTIASFTEVIFAIHHGSPLATRPSVKSPRVHRVSRGVQHVTLKDDTLITTFHPFQQVTPKSTDTSQRIPHVLHLTSKEDRLEQLPPKLQTNMRNEIRRNTEFTVKYWGDIACHDYLVEYYEAELLERFENAGRGNYGGAYRGDICRAAVLLREGGFYMDVDVQLAVPLRDLVDNTTSFMGVRHSNMLFGAIPNHQILNDTIKAILPWYRDFDSGLYTDILGPVTMERAFAQSCECGMNCFPDHSKFRCGRYIVELFNEMKLQCDVPSEECPASRIRNIEDLKSAGQEYRHLKFGILGPNRNKVVGWSRFEQCSHFGCEGSGYSDKDFVDMKAASAMSVDTDSIIGSSMSIGGSTGHSGYVQQAPIMAPQDVPSQPGNSLPPGILGLGSMPMSIPQTPYPSNIFPQAPNTQSSPLFGQSAPMAVIQPVIITVQAS